MGALSTELQTGHIRFTRRDAKRLMDALIVDLIPPFTQILVEVSQLPDGLTFGIHCFGHETRLL